jgi:fatty-acyl-CoA synthase
MENALAEHPDVEDAAVIGLEYEKWEERPFALVVPVVDGSVDGADLREHLASQSFVDWQLPDEIEFVDEVPKTSVGKNDKVTLRDRYGGRYVEA